ncbi:MAG: tetratricopeptide repeat protein [Verrucomicrobiia bacterium]
MQPSPYSDEPRILDETGDAFFEQHKPTLIAGGVILILGLIGALWFWQAQESRNLAALELFSRAETAEAWREVADTYPGTPAAAMAILKLANQAQQEGAFDLAASTYDRFLTAYPRHPIAPAAQFALGRSLQAAGKPAEAIPVFENIIAAKPRHPFFAGACVSLAEIHLAAGNTAAAKEILDTFFLQDIPSSYTPAARSLMAQINATP